MDFFGDPDFRVLQEFCTGGVLFWIWTGMLVQQAVGQLNRAFYAAATVMSADRTPLGSS